MNTTLIINTIIHLRPTQIYHQMLNRVVNPHFREWNGPLSAAPLAFEPWIEKPACWSDSDGTFCFLNQEDNFKGWNSSRFGNLWTYNLNYMDWLLQPGIDAESAGEWIDRFIDDLPGNHVGIDPYPTALRAINWIKFICAHGREFPQQRVERWNHYLRAQCAMLERRLEWHLLANHLLEDLYSLFIASIYFNDEKLYRKISRLLSRQLEEQMLRDGAHYEQSPMYQCILLDRLLDCINFSANNVKWDDQQQFNDLLRGYARPMLGHITAMVYSDGSLPLLNDSARCIAPTPDQLLAYGERLGLVPDTLAPSESGYRPFKAGRLEGIIDTGNIAATYQPGHSHADTFNYELRIDGKPFVVDTGISTYEKNARRQYERSTAAHNTVTVDDRDSSEVWSGFRVGRRARVEIMQDTPRRITARHDGFGKDRLHTRDFEIGPDTLRINDHLPDGVKGVSRIHLAPGILACVEGSTVVTPPARIATEGATRIEVVDNFVAQEYNKLRAARVVEIHFTGSLSYTIVPNK